MKTLFALLFTLALQAQELSIEELNLKFNDPVDIEFLEFPLANNQFETYMIVAERAGKVWVCDRLGDTWIKRATPILDTTDQVTTNFERGVQSIQVDKDFLWLYYTVEEESIYTQGQIDELTQQGIFTDDLPENTFTINRVSRWFVSWVVNSIDPFESILIGSDLSNGIPSFAGNHNGGGMVLDGGLLYIATGDSGSNSYTNVALALGAISEEEAALNTQIRSQSLLSLNGKILRVFSAVGNPIADNPWNEPGNGNAKLIWATGFRNPFRMTMTPEGDLIINDVGGNGREEISICSTEFGGQNFGWRTYEGFDFGSNTSGVDPFDGVLYTLNQSEGYDVSTDPEINHITHAPPELDYKRGGTPETRLRHYENGVLAPIQDTNPISGNCISGGTFVTNDFREGWEGAYVFTDCLQGWLNIAFKKDEVRYFERTENLLGNGTFGLPVDIEQYGNALYVADLFGSIHKVYFDEPLGLSESIEQNQLPIGNEYKVYNLLGQELEKGIIGIDFNIDNLKRNQITILKVEGFSKGLKIEPRF